MAVRNRVEQAAHRPDTPLEDKSISDAMAFKAVEKGPMQSIVIVENAHESAHGSLHRGLKARHMTMIAIGGAVGTGLIIGTYVLQFVSGLFKC